MTEMLQEVIDFLAAEQTALAMLVLFLTSLIEYVFPPFPGDTVTLFGAFLAVHGGWSIPLVMVVVITGSVLGAAFDYGVGHRLATSAEKRPKEKQARLYRAAQPVLVRFQRWGPLLIVLNRFMPGIRPFIFVAAGMDRLPLRQVLLLGLVSSVVWNGLLVAAGLLIGRNWERLLTVLQTYQAVAWGVIALGGVIVTIKVARQTLADKHNA